MVLTGCTSGGGGCRSWHDNGSGVNCSQCGVGGDGTVHGVGEGSDLGPGMMVVTLPKWW